MEGDDVLVSPDHIDDDPMSPGQDSVSSTQSYLTLIDDKPVAEYLMQSDIGDRPPIFRDLIGMWDGLLDDGRWTTGSLYYEDGVMAEGITDSGRLTYDESGHDRYRRASETGSPVHGILHARLFNDSRWSEGHQRWGILE